MHSQNPKTRDSEEGRGGVRSKKQKIYVGSKAERRLNGFKRKKSWKKKELKWQVGQQPKYKGKNCIRD